VDTLPISTSVQNSLMTRYKDAYRVASTINGLGQLIKIVGFLIGVLIVAGTLFVEQSSRSASPFGGGFLPGPATTAFSPGISPIVLGGAVAGGMLAFIFWVTGVFVSAQGQMLKASVDSAVNTSPLLTDDLRIQIMMI
jgi:hypothetical protein